MHEQGVFGLHVRPDGVAVLTYDVPGARVNLLSRSLPFEIEAVVERIETDDQIRAAVIVSGKPGSFIAGADLTMLAELRTREDAEAACRDGHRAIERLAAAKKPVIAAIHGAALGGGFEIALACAARVASADPATVLGLPAVRVGLIPALHGLQRVAELAGLETAVDLGTRGRSIHARRARALGLVDEVVAPDALLGAAATLALSTPAAGRRRHAPSARRRVLESTWPGRALLFRAARREVGRRTRGYYPAPEKVIEVLEALAARGFRASADVEARALSVVAVSSVSRRLVTLFFDSVETEKALGSPPGRLVAGEPLGFAMRIAAPMVQEAAWLLSEGCRPEEVDEAMLDWGFRRGPFTLVDEVGIDAFVRADALLEAAHGARLRPPPILKRLLARGVRRVRGEHPRSGASFYDAAGLAAPRSGRRLPVRREIIQMRCALRLVNEAILCLDDGGVSAARDGDVIAVKSVGFPPFRGGPFRYVEELGAAELSARMRGFEASFGSRFTPAPRLSDLAGRGGCFER